MRADRLPFVAPPIEVPDRSCGFCDNWNGVVPPHGEPAVVHHDERLYVILAPSSLGGMPGHALVIPTRHVETFLDLTDEEAGEVAIMTKRVAGAIRDAFDPNGIHIQQHNGAAAWQTIPHVHVHIIPVMEHGDWPPKDWVAVTPSTERQQQARRLAAALQHI